ncbi:MAG: hypothetical protein ACYCS8_07620 [Acidithiobacillus sp.]
MSLQPKVHTSQPPANMQALGLVSVLNRKRYSAETRHHQITDTAGKLMLQAVQGTGNSGAEVHVASFITTNDDDGRPEYMVGYGTVCIPTSVNVEQNVEPENTSTTDVVHTFTDTILQLKGEKQDLESQRDAALGMIDRLVRWAEHVGSIESPCWSKARNFLADNVYAVANDGDYGLTVEQLEEKYGHREHPDYIREEWSEDVGNGDTNLGYWDWVLHNVESHYGDACENCGKAQCDKVYVPDLGLVCRDCAVDYENGK